MKPSLTSPPSDLETSVLPGLKPLQFSWRGLVLSVPILGRLAESLSGSSMDRSTISPATRRTGLMCLAARVQRPMWREPTGETTGTGRADRVVHYRNTALKIIDFALQGQFRATGNDSTTDGVGASLQFKLLPGLKAGGTYTRTNWSPTQRTLIRGLGGDADYMALGTRLDWRILELGFVYSHQHNGDLVRIPTRPERT